MIAFQKSIYQDSLKKCRADQLHKMLNAGMIFLTEFEKYTQ